jgi:septum site-determining protein MinD
MILAVTAGKGGVGKSTVAYNLAAELDAVVVDADLGMADLPTARGPDLHDVLAGRATPLEAVQDVGPVAMVPCGRSLAGARATEPTALIETVEAVARRHGTVVIDTPAGMRSDAGLPLLAAEACLLVTRPTRPAIADAVRARELARVLETPLVRVALNRVDPAQIGTQTERDRQLANTLGAPIHKIPDSKTVARAQRAGQPVGVIDQSAPATKQFATLAGDVERALS